MPMPTDPKQETLRQIQQAWDSAQAQLAELRDPVETTTRLAQAKVTQNFLERDLDRAYRDLGEAVWAQVSKGRPQLPPTLATVMEALSEARKKIHDQNWR